jgi:hypothetical protein
VEKLGSFTGTPTLGKYNKVGTSVALLAIQTGGRKGGEEICRLTGNSNLKGLDHQILNVFWRYIILNLYFLNVQ